MNYAKINNELTDLDSLTKEELTQMRNQFQENANKLRETLNSIGKSGDTQCVQIGKGGKLRTDYEDLKNKYEAEIQNAKNVEEKLAQFINSARKYDKFQIFSNIRELCKNKDIKIGTVEKEAGVALGYMSRLEKANNASEPSLDFVVAAATTLGVTVDDLLYKQFSLLSANQIFLLSFLEKLKNDTSNDALRWEKETEEKLNTITSRDSSSVFFDLFSYRNKGESIRTHTSTEKKIFLSNTFASETYVDGDCFTVSLGQAGRIFLMAVDDLEHTPTAREVWMQTGGYQPSFLVSTYDPYIGVMVDELYDAVKNQFMRPTLSVELQNAISLYMDIGLKGYKKGD